MLAAVQPADTARGNYSEDPAAGGGRFPEADGINAGKPNVRAQDIFSIASPPATEIVKLTAPDPSVNHWFGYSVSISGDYVIVGAAEDDDGGAESGAAYVFYRNQGGPDGWGLVAKLRASDAAADDKFGTSVSISGDYAIVGAEQDDDDGAESGAAYIFYRNQGGADSWGQLTKLTASDAAANDWFGSAVSIDGDYAFVGADGDDDSGNFSGSAYMFYRNYGGADNWGQVTKLKASDGIPYNWFGSSLSINGDYAIVGARGNNDQGTESGAAYVFYRNQGGPDSWGQVTKLTASDAADKDHFGFSVSISGDYAVVGARDDDDSGNSSGSAYIFNRNQGGPDNWGQLTKLTASDAAVNDEFGVSVSIDGDYAVVGAAFNDANGISGSGAAYIFYRNEGGPDNWGQLAKLIASDAGSGDLFGKSVSIHNAYATIGAWVDDGAVSNSGSAYIFSDYTGYSIWASAGPGGSISPSGKVRVIRSSSKTFNITPDPGYEIADVIVDGSSVGVVSSYTFHNVSSNHMIKAEFEAAPGLLLVHLGGLHVDIPGLQWQVSGSGSWNSCGETVPLTPGSYTVTFMPAPGWLIPDVEVVVPIGSGVVKVRPQPIPFLITHCSDYDGDGACDISLFRPSTGKWLVLDILEKEFGKEGDWPVPGDYDGDGIADLAYWRPGNGVWRVWKQFRIKGFGQKGDVPVPADYDGDGLTDAALFRRSTCEWIVRHSSTGTTETTAFSGKGFCVPLPRDYDGDGRANLAVYSLADRAWSIHAFGGGGVDKIVRYSRGGDVPVPADYNCDGLADIAMLNRKSGLWRVYGLFKAKVSSKTGDVPVIGDFDCDGYPEFGLFRCANGVWYLGSRIEFGSGEDIPLTRGR